MWKINRQIVTDLDSVLYNRGRLLASRGLPGGYGKILCSKMKPYSQLGVAFGVSRASVNSFGGFQAIFEPTM